ncbi:hypothetical protein [Rhizobium sp.]|uniref:hypothetical protein n=1 Tax=Rhizobium sp. TaxID=391 RepID=UPI0028AC59B4
MHLVRDLLDKQLVDHHHQKIGQVDGVVIDMRDGQQPRIAAIETGSGVVLDRVGWKTDKRRFRIAMSKLVRIKVDVTVDIDPEEMPVVQWQDWLRKRILRWIPGGAS